MANNDPYNFGPYAAYLHTDWWPSFSPHSGEHNTVLVHRDSMPPQYASAALAKLVRWARIAPEGEMTMYPDEDSREVAVRSTNLGRALAARAVNLDPELFFGMYGEFGAGEEADSREVIAEIAVALGDHGLDWSLQQRIKLAIQLQETLTIRYRFNERVT